MKFKNKVAVITGGGQGIGEKIALLLADEGCSVAVIDINFKKASAVAKSIFNKGGKGLALKSDISKLRSVEEMIGKILAHFGKIDILINNAGIQTTSPFLDITEKEWQRIFYVNLKGAFLCSKIIANEMCKQNKGGNIVNISSIHHSVPRFNRAHYDASKAGLVMLTKDMALELSKYKINVNCVAPGAIITPMNKDIVDSQEKTQEISERIPWGRMGSPEEVAKLVCFLVSEDAEYITGSVINIDGGLSLRF